MGIVAKEAGRSGIALALGLVVGTLNTVLVLPRAFEGAEEHWGLVRVLSAWSYIVAPVVMLGGSGILLRNFNKVDPKLRGALHASVWFIAFIGLFVWGGILAVKGEWLMRQLDADKGGLLVDHLGLFFLMNTLVVGTNLSSGMLVLGLKVSWFTWVNEVWLKGSYLALALLLWADFISLETLVYAYAGTWVVALIALVWQVKSDQTPFSFAHWRSLDWAENLRYGGYSFLTQGAGIVATNLDFVMVGALLGLSVVPVYTMGYFIGSVVQLPQRSLSNVFSGIASKRLAHERPEQMQPFIQQATRVNLLLSVVLFIGVCAGLEPLMSALPGTYAGISGVAIAIGLQKVAMATALSSAQVLSHTPHYRLNLPLNVGLLVTTVATNWLLMSHFEWGVTGAALATLFTAIWNSSWRLVILYRKVGIHPFSRAWFGIIALGGAMYAATLLIPSSWTGGHGYLEASINGGAAAGATLAAAYALGLFPELKSALEIHVFSRFR